MKFGGTSVEDGPAFDRVAQIVQAYQCAAPVVIVSAMSRVTDALMASQHLAARGKVSEAIQSLEEHFERHLRVANRLGMLAQSRMPELVEKARREIIELLNMAAGAGMTTTERQDTITSHGERLSANLLTIVLEEYGLPAAYVDARRCILTNEEYGNAQPLIQESCRRTRSEIEPLLEARRVPVLGGFIAATKQGVTTTLGRGSSDYTATLVSAALGARETQIWTDVDGILTADPRLVKTARTVPELSYGEAAELARLGARVLHPKMIQPVLEQQIPIRICNSRAPEESGTLICAKTKTSAHAVKAIAHKTDLTRVDITSEPALVANGFMHAIERIFERHQTHMDIVAMSAVGISCAFAAAAPPSIVPDLEQVGLVEIQKHRAIISCVGEGLQSAREVAEKILQDIDPSLAWQSTSTNNLISVVDGDSVGPVVRRLHQGIFELGQSQQR